MREAVFVGLIFLALVGEAFCERQRPITLRFENADIRTSLQAFTDLGNVNIVTSEAVSSRGSLNLKEAPWDQASRAVLEVVFAPEQTKFSKQAKEREGFGNVWPLPFFLKICNRYVFIFREFFDFIVVKPFLMKEDEIGIVKLVMKEYANENVGVRFISVGPTARMRCCAELTNTPLSKRKVTRLKNFIDTSRINSTPTKIGGQAKIK